MVMCFRCIDCLNGTRSLFASSSTAWTGGVFAMRVLEHSAEPREVFQRAMHSLLREAAAIFAGDVGDNLGIGRDGSRADPGVAIVD